MSGHEEPLAGGARAAGGRQGWSAQCLTPAVLPSLLVLLLQTLEQIEAEQQAERDAAAAKDAAKKQQSNGKAAAGLSADEKARQKVRPLPALAVGGGARVWSCMASSGPTDLLPAC